MQPVHAIVGCITVLCLTSCVGCSYVCNHLLPTLGRWRCSLQLGLLVVISQTLMADDVVIVCQVYNFCHGRVYCSCTEELNWTRTSLQALHNLCTKKEEGVRYVVIC